MEPIMRLGRPGTKSCTHSPQLMRGGEGDRLPIFMIHLPRGRRGCIPLPKTLQPIRLRPEDAGRLPRPMARALLRLPKLPHILPRGPLVHPGDRAALTTNPSLPGFDGAEGAPRTSDGAL
eukprot:7493549-Pyramimonas_sp.AAC.1